MTASSMNMTCIIGALQTYNIMDGGVWRDSYYTSAAHVLSFRRLYNVLSIVQVIAMGGQSIKRHRKKRGVGSYEGPWDGLSYVRCDI